MPDMVSLVVVLSGKRIGLFTISDDHDVPTDDRSTLELYAWESVLNFDDFLAQAKLATGLKGSFVQDLLVVRPTYG